MLVHQDLKIIRNKDFLQIKKHRAYQRDFKHQDTHLTSLMKAVGNGDIELVKDLLKKNADIFAIDPITGISVVHFAAQGGNVEVMRLLIEHGAESIINLQAASNTFTPLMVAVWYQNPEMIRYLLSLEHINANLKDQFGRTAAEFPVPDKRTNKLHPIDKEITEIFKVYFENYNRYMSDKFE